MGRLKYIFHCILHMDYKSLFDTVKTVHEVSGKNRIWLFLTSSSAALSTVRAIKITFYARFMT